MTTHPPNAIYRNCRKKTCIKIQAVAFFFFFCKPDHRGERKQEGHWIYNARQSQSTVVKEKASEQALQAKIRMKIRIEINRLALILYVTLHLRVFSCQLFEISGATC